MRVSSPAGCIHGSGRLGFLWEGPLARFSIGLALKSDRYSESPPRLEEAQLKDLTVSSRLVRKPRGAFVFLQGDPAASIYLVKEGRVKVSLLLESGKELTVDIAGPGEIIGEMGLIDDAPKTRMAQALDDVELFAIDKAEFERLLLSHPPLLLYLARFIAWRQRRIERRLMDVAYRDIIERISELLAEFASDHHPAASGPAEILIPLTHGDIASMIGASRPKTTTALNKLERMGLIELGRRSIRIKSIEIMCGGDTGAG
jgi:CRP/FNR family transcriptional regulator